MSNITVARDSIVHITALCPFCQSAYQVEAALRGKLVRCPNATCNKVFPVPAEPPPPEAPASPPQPRPRPSPAGGQRSGTVGDLVPILPAEQAAAPIGSGTAAKHVSEMVPVVPAAPAAEGQPAEGDWWHAAPPVRDPSAQPPARSPATPSPPPATPETTWWQNAPPPVRKPQQPAEQPPPKRRRRSARSTGETQPIRLPENPVAQTQQMQPVAPEQREQPRELPPGTWEPPPVRRGAAAGEPQTQTEEATPPSETHQPRLSKRRARLIMVSISALAFLALGGVGVWVWLKILNSESSLSKQADEYYGQGSFSSASDKFKELLQRFPNSDRKTEYEFMAEWSEVSHLVSSDDADQPVAIARFEQFLKEHKDKKDQLMVDKAHDAGQRLLKLTATFAARNQNPPDDAPLKDAERIEQIRGMVVSLDAAALTKKDLDQIDTDLRQVRKAVEIARKRRAVLAQLRKKDGETWMDAIKRARSLVASMEREVPNLGKDAEPAIAQLYDGHRASVKYHPRTDDLTPPPHPPEDDAETLLFAPLLPSASPGNAPSNDPIVLALVRGILYALKQSNGELKWATRVGVDTTVLPQRVPESAINPELLLVLSADTHTLSALDLKGNTQWEYHVGQPVLGKPIIIDERAYLADYAGWVHEIELSRGQLLGRWSLGQPLTRGGAREGDTSLIYFPADDSCTYVLDVNPKNRKCVTILYDGHRSGSLRSEPIIIPPVGENFPGFLIFNQTKGLDDMQLQVFELPLQDRFGPPLTLDPPAWLPGWTWFEPKQDGEKLAVLTDAGFLGLFGIRQPGNQDPALFPLLQQGGLDLSPFLPNRKALPRERGRSQVVHMRGEDLWVLARGQFQQLKLRMDWNKGPQASSSWPEPLHLGSPLHEPQRTEDRNTGHSTFFLVTQALEQQMCLASAVDNQGKIVWQRQLGLVCQGEPLALTPPDGDGLPLLLALDQGGGLFALDPSFPPGKLNSCWRLLAPSLAENPLVPSRLLPAADGRSAYEIAAPGDGRELIVRHIEWAGKRELTFAEHKLSLLGPAGIGVLTPAGPPIVLGSQLLMPMSDGIIKRIALGSEKPEPGPSWRASGVSAAATCSLLALPNDRFLSTDGSRGLTVYEWRPSAGQWQNLSSRQLEQLVAAPPVLIPAADGQQPDVAVADSAGVLHLFTVKPDGSLQPKPDLRWELPGNLSAGPFVLAEPKGGWRIGCVLDRRRLLWLDPAKKQPLWIYDTGGPAILGHPRWVEDMLVVALQSGQYVGIDPVKGQPLGRGYTLRTSAAPAATPMSFGPGRMFTPLTDGTALLLSCDRLRTPAKR